MSSTIAITSAAQFDSLLKSSKIVVVDFWAEWCKPCLAMAPLYEQLSASLSRPRQMTFTKIDTEQQQELAAKYQVTTLPTFMIFKNGKVVEQVQGSNVKKLQEVVKRLAAEAEGSGAEGFAGGSGSGADGWRVGELPRGYSDVSDQVDVKGLELLNADNEFGGVRVLFDGSKPSGLAKGKAPATKDWVESDTDEQLMMFLPFQATLKVHTLQITSLPPTAEDDDNEAPLRPKTINIYHNRAHILGFEEADDIPATQTVTLTAQDWDATGTATIPLRFVKFQSVTSLVLFIVDGDGEGERVRVDRFRIIGETGEKRDQGKLEKIEHD